MLRRLTFLSALTLILAVGCDDDDDNSSNGDAGQAGAGGGAGSGGGEAGSGGGEAGSGGGEAGSGGEGDCAVSCERFAECSISECAGYDEEDRTRITTDCLNTCTTALSNLVKADTACEQVKSIAAGNSEVFAVCCDDPSQPQCDPCVGSCERFAECSISECVGYEEADRERITTDCLDTCTVAMSNMVTRTTACEQVKQVAAGTSEVFAVCCDDPSQPQCGGATYAVIKIVDTSVEENMGGTAGVDICDVSVDCAEITNAVIDLGDGLVCTPSNIEHPDYDLECTSGKDRADPTMVYDDGACDDSDSYASIGIDGVLSVTLDGDAMGCELTVSEVEGNDIESYAVYLCEAYEDALEDCVLVAEELTGESSVTLAAQ